LGVIQQTQKTWIYQRNEEERWVLHMHQQYFTATEKRNTILWIQKKKKRRAEKDKVKNKKEERTRVLV